MSRYVCIHGHFYQPPRENPWLEAIEQQESARPYHDWNHRITAECYGPNAFARILDERDYIVNIVNNYELISFNMGPTLLSWMEQEQPEVYKAIIDADRQSVRRFGGHGSAMAQVYNHVIMPLASERDMATQVCWGVRDFEHRFGRKPRGMWLAETAADTASLEALAAAGIEFTVLAPRQCARVRAIDESGRPAGDWRSVGGAVDPSQPYWLNLPSGKRIAIFYYDGPISQAIAFERLLIRGESLASRLTTAFREGNEPQLVHVATDGETYGHHHRRGEMALAYALHEIERNGLARITNYSEYLSLHPPKQETEIVENSSWSCEHGVERWRADCGCRADGRGWSQAWRRPLREALDWLRDELAGIFATHCPLPDPWAARDDFIELVLDRSDQSLAKFLARNGGETLSAVKVQATLSLLEMQRHGMLMYTSCGWFFDELSGIETIQVLRYAGRAIQLALPYASELEADFLARVSAAKSNLPEWGDGAAIYAKAVRPAVVDLPKVVAHYAVSSLFRSYGTKTSVYGFDVEQMDRHSWAAGKRRLVIGQVRCRSELTREEATLSFAALHLGDQNLSGGVRAFRGQEQYETMVAEVSEKFQEDDLPEVMRRLDRYFLEMTYSLSSLFHDQQLKVLEALLSAALADATEVSLRLHKEHAGLIRKVASLDVPLPQLVRTAADFVLQGSLRKALEDRVPDRGRVMSLLAEARQLHVELDSENLAASLQKTLEALADRFVANPLSLERLIKLAQATQLLAIVPFEVELMNTQTQIFRVAKTLRPEVLAGSENGDQNHAAWLLRFEEVAEALKIRLQ